MRQIKLTRGFFATIDDEDYEKLSKYKWHYRKGKYNKTGYAARAIRVGDKIKVFFMHREIMNNPIAMDIDHENHDTLDNQKENLKICTHRENLKNRVNKAKPVYDERQSNKPWRVVIGSKYITSFETEVLAKDFIDNFYNKDEEQDKIIEERKRLKTSRHIGIRLLRDKWQAYKGRVSLGFYGSEEEAVKARETADANNN